MIKGNSKKNLNSYVRKYTSAGGVAWLTQGLAEPLPRVRIPAGAFISRRGILT